MVTWGLPQFGRSRHPGVCRDLGEDQMPHSFSPEIPAFAGMTHRTKV
ncbi:MAG: hypothetical protein AVDCRST_MAG91-2279 [uncultured Sphingomonadaceae bacterium]|uniref:Uncharacterized protein n=1 Tax=uncultured Sphingomonadaceae bacterium TaxID=169976 RepID=A0A6J4TG68_9SPHN|nr:MAG: hypothetical protein AVDCRST_MAG91-2279 [uncultured Sphingomonadaceae bacterium]